MDKKIKNKKEEERKLFDELGSSEYKYGFKTDIDMETFGKGLNEDVIRLISEKKGEPEFLLEWRLQAFHHWKTMEMPDWAHLKLNPIDFQEIIYYAAPKKKKELSSLDEVDDEIIDTFNRLGIPLEEQKNSQELLLMPYLIQFPLQQHSLTNLKNSGSFSVHFQKQ